MSGSHSAVRFTVGMFDVAARAYPTTYKNIPEHLKRALESLSYNGLHEPFHIDYRFHYRTSEEQDMDRVYEHIADFDSSESLLRSVILTKPRAQSGKNGRTVNPKKVFLIHVNGGCGFVHPNDAEFSVEIQISEKNAVLAVIDHYTDIAMANSFSIRPVIENALASKGLQWIYQQKVDVARTRGNEKTFYGEIEDKVCYIPFAAMVRSERLIGKPEDVTSLVNLWDALIVGPLKQFRPASSEWAELLRAKPGVGGQLGESVLKDVRKLPDGIFYLIRHKRWPHGNDSKSMKLLRKFLPQIGDHLGAYAILKKDDVWVQGSPDPALRQLIGEDIVSVSKLYCKG